MKLKMLFEDWEQQNSRQKFIIEKLEDKVLAMEKLLMEKEEEAKSLRIERAENVRKIEQLEEQNDNLLAELASMKMMCGDTGTGGGREVLEPRASSYDANGGRSDRRRNSHLAKTKNTNTARRRSSYSSMDEGLMLSSPRYRQKGGGPNHGNKNDD